MRSLFRENAGEALVGLLVVLLAAWFAWFAWVKTGGGVASGAIRVEAIFPSVNGIEAGTDVRIAGLKVGAVVEQKLDPQTFQVRTTLALNPDVHIPADSSAAITSEGLLGGSYVSLIPGGSEQPLKNGDVISDTQGSVDLMSLFGQFINRSGSADQTAATPEP